MWSDELTVAEADFTQHAVDVLANVSWAQPLLTRFNKRGGLKSENMPLLFEIRFALELYRAGVRADYEYPTGVGDSSVDFHFKGDTEWIIEVVSVCESDAVKRATHQNGQLYQQRLSTNNADPAQSVEAEMITVEQKIGEKAYVRGRPTKFPVPNGAIHLIIIDMRGYLGRGRNATSRDFIPDYQQIAYGYRGIPPNLSWMVCYWDGRSGNREPIKGLFERSNPLKSAPLIQERIHFLGFVLERNYCEGEIADVGYYLANPHLFSDDMQAREAYESFPLKRRL
ncbi:MAG: hypothetical protein AB1631_03925 [Acidobacteriota bacterium]